MKSTELHTLIKQHIPQITYLETDTNEAAEGECTIWEQDDCTIMIELANPNADKHLIIVALQQIAAQLTFLDTHRERIHQLLATETQVSDLADSSMVYTAFLIEDEDHVFCDFAVATPSLGERVASCSLEEDFELIFNELE